ncbi:2OG-Fe(II) oxygenase family protein [Aquitalea denitrificans]|uniref:2OG-Fe(II) oxygenase family protein n=1 Tax=Aquitalea denitrificans TaxID=519081 RepID=UPI00135808A8
MGGAYQPFVKDSSYLQFCVYHPDYQIDDREYLQDPHEDGHLLTFIKPTSSGLFLHTKTGIIPASPSTDQLVVLAGSLLEILTDGEVCAMHHSVKNPPTPTLRKSLMYFMNPNLSSPKTTSLIKNKTIDLVSQANHHHAKFGNNPLSTTLDT